MLYTTQISFAWANKHSASGSDGNISKGIHMKDPEPY